jgi:hypothetical protein
VRVLEPLLPEELKQAELPEVAARIRERMQDAIEDLRVA